MNKIAIFVEGQTEQIFVSQLILEIAGYKNVVIELQKFREGGRPEKVNFPNQSTISPISSFLIYNGDGDKGFVSRIREEYQGLMQQGYAEIIGLRDLYPLQDIAKLEYGLQFSLKNYSNTSVVIAVHEIEAWFLAEVNHFSCIDNRLTATLIQSAQVTLGFNPYKEDMTLRAHPADDLKNIYQLVGKSYTKKRDNVERTIKCLDFANLYLTLRQYITKLDELISKIETYL